MEKIRKDGRVRIMAAAFEMIAPTTEFARKITYTRTESGSLRHNVEIDLDRIYRAVENQEAVYLNGDKYVISRVIMSPNRSHKFMTWDYYLELAAHNGSVQAPAEHVKFSTWHHRSPAENVKFIGG